MTSLFEVRAFTMRANISFHQLPVWLQQTHSLKRSCGRMWWDNSTRNRGWRIGTPDGSVRTVLPGDVIVMDRLGGLNLERQTR